MKKILLLILFLFSLSETYAFNISYIEDKNTLLRLQYNNKIDNLKKERDVKIQQKIWECNKYRISCNTDYIKKEYEAKINDLKEELNYRISRNTWYRNEREENRNEDFESNALNSNKLNNIDKNNIIIETNILKKEKELADLEPNTKEYINLKLEILELKKEILNNDISKAYLLYLNPDKTYENDTYLYRRNMYDSIVNLNNQKQEILDDQIKKLKKLLNDKIKEEEKLKEKELLKQNKEQAVIYLEKADKYLKNLDIKNSISYYKISCNLNETYRCYYWLWLANYKLAKKYFENIGYYWYKKLFNKAKEEAIKNLNLSLELTDNKEEIENTYKLIDEIKNFPNKNKKVTKVEKNIKKVEDTKKPKKENKKNKVDKKVELILIKLNKITKNFSEDKKLKLYKKLILKLEKYSRKSNNKVLKEIINKLILRLKEKISKQ